MREISANIKVAAWPISRASLSAGPRLRARPRDSQGTTGPTIDRTRLPLGCLGQNASPADDARQDRKARAPDRVRSAFRDVSCEQQGNAHEAMPDHERDCCSLFLGERQELRRKLAHHVAVERDKIRDPEAVEDREQQQRVFGRLSERFSLFDQQTCPLRSRLGFRRSIPFDMDEWRYERDLKLDLLATQRRRGWARSRSDRGPA